MTNLDLEEIKARSLDVIAGMDPEATLALVEEVERLRGEVADLLADLDHSEWKHSETLERLTVTDYMVERADAKAREEAHKRFPKPIDVETGEPVDDWGFSECSRESFIDGATWALSSQWTITDDMIARAANAIWYGQLPDDPPWEEQKNITRHALEAALKEDQ